MANFHTWTSSASCGHQTTINNRRSTCSFSCADQRTASKCAYFMIAIGYGPVLRWDAPTTTTTAYRHLHLSLGGSEKKQGKQTQRKLYITQGCACCGQQGGKRWGSNRVERGCGYGAMWYGHVDVSTPESRLVAYISLLDGSGSCSPPDPMLRLWKWHLRLGLPYVITRPDHGLRWQSWT